MSSQAFAGAVGTLAIVLAVLVVVLERARRRAELDAWAARGDLERSRSELAERMRQGEHDAGRQGAETSLARAQAERAERKLEELQLELARRREGPIVEGENVALTTPGDRTIRGVVRQVFDNGAVLLGAAIVYVEREGRAGLEVEELDAGDVVVPVHRWAQKLPPEPPPEV